MPIRLVSKDTTASDFGRKPDRHDADFEITIFTTLFQGVGYLVMIGVANLFYFVGPISERVFCPRDAERYRRVCFQLGFWFSVLLPFSIPALLAVLALFHPEHFRDST